MSLDPNSVTPSGQEDKLPTWRNQFPIDTDKEVANSRRQFVAGSLVAGGAMACGQVALNAVSRPHSGDSHGPIDTSHGDLILEKKFQDMEIGEAQLFHYPDERSPCLLVKLDKENFVAYAQKCTHLACPVIPDVDRDEFHCPCHHGKFDLRTGQPSAGPPRSPLPKLSVELAEDGTLKVQGIS